jgi:hypothetical protein
MRLAIVSLLLSTAVFAGDRDRPPDQNGTPNLIVDAKVLSQHWIVRNENFVSDACDVVEGGVQAGNHAVIRFTVSTPNIGDADMYIGDPNVHSRTTTGSTSSRSATTTSISGTTRSTSWSIRGRGRPGAPPSGGSA